MYFKLKRLKVIRTKDLTDVYKETRRRLFLVTGDLSSLAIGEEEWRGIFLIGLRKEGENVNISSQFSFLDDMTRVFTF